MIGGSWQDELAEELRRRAGSSARLAVVGSAAATRGTGASGEPGGPDRPDGPDGWSDLDVRLELDPDTSPDLLAGLGVWAYEVHHDDGRQVVRTVLDDGRRLDLSIGGGSVPLPVPAVDNAVRFLAATAAVKLGRGDRLIGLHLALEVAREALVLAMLLRDRDRGTSVHRTGSERDSSADRVLAALRPGATPEALLPLVETYGAWRVELDPDHRPDWSGLRAVIDRGRGRPSPR